MIDTLDILRTEVVDDEMYEEDYVEHYGILGMKWGIRRTPEQLGHRVSKAREKFLKYSEKAQAAGETGNVKKLAKYTKKSEKTAKQVVKLNKSLEKALKRQAEEDEKIISKGDLDEVMKISDRLSQEQIDRAYKRISGMQKLESLRPSGEAALDKLVSVGSKVASGAQSAYNIIDNVNKFKGVMKEIKQSEIKEVEEAKEKARKKAVTAATRTGNVDEMKKVWGMATVEELKDMSDTRKLRFEIENMDFNKMIESASKASSWEARKFSKSPKDDDKKK